MVRPYGTWLCFVGLVVVSISGGAVMLSSMLHHAPCPIDQQQQQLDSIARRGANDARAAGAATAAGNAAATDAPSSTEHAVVRGDLQGMPQQDSAGLDALWTWQAPPTAELVLPRSTLQWDLGTHEGATGLKARRICVQEHLFRAMGTDAPLAYFVQGCDYSPLYDFEGWAKRTGCGSEPVEGVLRYHVAWTGPYAHVREDLDALINSFLTTQDTARSRLTFWLIETDPNPSDDFQRSHAGHDSVEFLRADMELLAKGTAMEGLPDFLHLDWNTVKKGPRWRANLFRVLILHVHGGVWVDTDSLFLRDIRPLVEFAGEFASKLTMSHYYNNNVMALRAGSTLGAQMIEDIVATPFQQGERSYCKHVGPPCYPKWTWNHGLIQLAVRNQRGIVIFPTQFTDPAYACFPPWLLAKSGGMAMRDFAIQEIAEFIRGAFVLHTRAYNADKPINKNSNYGRLYALAAKGAAAGGAGASELVPLEPRNREHLEGILARRGNAVNVVDPAFIPRGGKRFILLKSVSTGKCVDARRGVKGETFGGFPTLQAAGNCASAQKKFNETVVYMWYQEWGYLRPAHREPGRVLCVDALAYTIYPPKSITWTVAPQMITCKADRPSQQWIYDAKTGEMKNPYSQLCMDPGRTAGQLALRPCDGGHSQKLEMMPFEAKLPKDFDACLPGSCEYQRK